MSVATEVRVPDIGDFTDVPIIEVHVKPGDRVNEDDPLLTLESDKATMDVPSPLAGVVREVPVKVGDQVSQGSLILQVEPGDGAVAEPPSLVEQQEPEELELPESNQGKPNQADQKQADQKQGEQDQAADFSQTHAGPSVRRLAREFGIDLTSITGTGPKGRITKDDVLSFLKGPAATPAAPAAQGSGIPEIPVQDFSKFGPIEVKPLVRIKKLSGPHLHRSWLNIPHVTHQDEADITELDRYRKELDTAAKPDGYRVTLLAFLIKAVVAGLKRFPEVNSSLNPDRDALIYKQYYNIGIAVDTPDGLVVPVLREADRKGITELSKELGAVSARAREGKLSSADLQGGTFTISSLGGIGGTAFTPIVNAPEVAILGVVRATTKPVWEGERFVPRLVLPLSLSYDHRVIDGALAARFTRNLADLLGDVRRILL
ncbi:MAG TPA: dihydrolipoyllysine-residue acetyltransferase [Kineosporiaceae bacterium]|nr:dihydrolipoyllysine-residue acetyltransferase [Kineosporiaceae bacterium]